MMLAECRGICLKQLLQTNTKPSVYSEQCRLFEDLVLKLFIPVPLTSSHVVLDVLKFVQIEYDTLCQTIHAYSQELQYYSAKEALSSETRSEFSLVGLFLYYK